MQPDGGEKKNRIEIKTPATPSSQWFGEKRQTGLGCPDPGGYSREKREALGPGWRLAEAPLVRAEGRRRERWGRRGARGAGESFMRSGRRCRRHSQSPRAARSRRERGERASERWEPASAEGAPGRRSRSGRSSSRRCGARREQKASEESASGTGRGPAGEAPVLLPRLPCQPGSARRPPRRPGARNPGPRCPRDGLGAREGG